MSETLPEPQRISFFFIAIISVLLILSFISLYQVFTTTKCSSCDFKNVRGFQNGEYILKAIEACPKCNSHMFISSIYGETEEKKE
jgi:hypothetical protein